MTIAPELRAVEMLRELLYIAPSCMVISEFQAKTYLKEISKATSIDPYFAQIAKLAIFYRAANVRQFKLEVENLLREFPGRREFVLNTAQMALSLGEYDFTRRLADKIDVSVPEEIDNKVRLFLMLDDVDSLQKLFELRVRSCLNEHIGMIKEELQEYKFMDKLMTDIGIDRSRRAFMLESARRVAVEHNVLLTSVPEFKYSAEDNMLFMMQKMSISFDDAFDIEDAVNDLWRVDNKVPENVVFIALVDQESKIAS